MPGQRNMRLFTVGEVVLHSGATSFWRIDCERFRNADWTDIAAICVAELDLRPFGRTAGVMRGGYPLAMAMERYTTRASDRTVICDDVLTTGGSMEEERVKHDPSKCAGLVVFARGPLPPWVKALWILASTQRPAPKT